MDGDKKPAPSEQDKPGWVFKPGETTASAPVATVPQPQAPPPVPPAPAPVQQQAGTAKRTSNQSVEWTASEFIAHKKSAGWYATVFLVAAAAAGLVYYFTRDEISATVIIVVAIAFAILGGRQPRVLAYRLDENGLAVGQKLHPYSEFKSFTIFEEGAFGNLTFLPLKRFMPAVNVYFAPDDAEEIMDVLTAYLPFERRDPGVFDSIVHRLRF